MTESEMFARFVQVLEDFLKEVKRARRADNARLSREKAIANGTRLGRKKVRNDQDIRNLRSLGLSIREIARDQNVSTAAVQRALKDP